MAGTSRGGRSGEGGTALTSVKTQRAVEAGAEEKAARAKAKGAAKPAGSGDSPKRQGDKLERARDAAAGRPKGR